MRLSEYSSEEMLDSGQTLEALVMALKAHAPVCALPPGYFAVRYYNNGDHIKLINVPMVGFASGECPQPVLFDSECGVAVPGRNEQIVGYLAPGESLDEENKAAFIALAEQDIKWQREAWEKAQANPSPALKAQRERAAAKRLADREALEAEEDAVEAA
jgi:hypothetical protein